MVRLTMPEVRGVRSPATTGPSDFGFAHAEAASGASAAATSATKVLPGAELIIANDRLARRGDPYSGSRTSRTIRGARDGRLPDRFLVQADHVARWIAEPRGDFG